MQFIGQIQRKRAQNQNHHNVGINRTLFWLNLQKRRQVLSFTESGWHFKLLLLIIFMLIRSFMRWFAMNLAHLMWKVRCFVLFWGYTIFAAGNVKCFLIYVVFEKARKCSKILKMEKYGINIIVKWKNMVFLSCSVFFRRFSYVF